MDPFGANLEGLSTALSTLGSYVFKLFLNATIYAKISSTEVEFDAVVKESAEFRRVALTLLLAFLNLQLSEEHSQRVTRVMTSSLILFALCQRMVWGRMSGATFKTLIDCVGAYVVAILDAIPLFGVAIVALVEAVTMFKSSTAISQSA